MRQLQLIHDPSEAPALNSHVTDEDLRAMGWTRSIEEWELMHGTEAQRAKRSKQKS